MTLTLDRADLLLARNFIGGRWQEAEGGARYAVTDPATNREKVSNTETGAANWVAHNPVGRCPRCRS